MEPNVFLFFISIIIIFLICVLIYRQRLGDAGDRRMKGFYPLCIVTLIWTALDAVKLLSDHEYYAYVFVPKVFFASIIPYVTFWFIINFTETKFAKTRWIKIIIIAIPTLINLILLTNPLHNLYFDNFDYPDPSVGTIPPAGPFFLVNIALITIGFFIFYTILFRYIIKNFRQYPFLIITGIGLIFPFALYLAFAINLFGLAYDLSPIGFFCSIVLFTYFSYSSRARNYRPKIFSDTLLKITKSPELSAGNIEEAAKMIVKEGCIAIGAHHIGIWNLEGNVLKNTMYYEMESENYELQKDVDLSNCSNYIEMLLNERLIVINDVNVPNVLSNVKKEYNPQICAILDTPIRVNGKLKGIVSVEQHHSKAFPERRMWTIEEQNFASSLADLMVIAIESVERRKLETAELANQAKDRFLAHMSHEMRTPMNALLGIAEIQLQNDNLHEETAKAFGQIYDSGDLLLNIINDILDLSKIEAGKLELIPVNYDIPSLINDTVQLNRLRYESSEVEFILDIDENTPHNLYGDELRIKQVLNNLLSNAFKYTSQGSINFSIFSLPSSEENVMLVFRVSDTGQGMTESQVSKLFDEYTRFNADANRETVGTGLGMNITKRLIDLMNGDITIQSEPGKGSVFTVRIPQKQIGTDVCGAGMTNELRDFRFKSLAISKRTQFLREYMPYGSVLVADDVASNIYVAQGMLSPYGLNIETVQSGYEVIDKVKNGNVYDIIFMDHMMPKLDGIETTKILRDMGYKNAIIALTANALVGRAEMFIKNGFDGFISKPIDSRELNHILNEFIRNKKPIELVKAARREQQKKLANSGSENQNTLNSGVNSAMAELFILDAESALNTLENLYKKINDLGNEDISSYIITVHGMKSALANLGEKKLSDIALNLELAGENRNLAELVKLTPAFIASLRSTIEKYKPKGKNDITDIDSADLDYLREKLNIIKKACEAFEKETAKTALNELKEKIWTSPVNALLDYISINILHSAFKKAAAAVSNYLQNNE